eukprot:gene7454-10164_t
MYLVRLLIVGDTGVGKTSLLIRFNEDNFVPDQKTTIGVDYKAKELEIGSQIVKLQVWDTAGQERFRSMTAAFYSKAQGVIITFDVNQRESFLNIPSWIRDVRISAPEYCYIILCANKIDIPQELWKVAPEEYNAFAKDNDLLLVECSAASGKNITHLFTLIGTNILNLNKNKLTEVEDSEHRGESLLLFNPNELEHRKRPEERCCTIS